MPWHVEQGTAGCDGWAVVKDADGSVAGCHPTEADALAQVAALYAQEPDMATAGLWSLASDGQVWCVVDDDDRIMSSYSARDAAVEALANLYEFDGCLFCLSPRHPGPCAKKKADIQTDTGGRISREEAGRKMLGDREYERRVAAKKKRRRASVSSAVDETVCPPGQYRMPDGACMPDMDMVAAMVDGTPVHGVLAVEGQPTGDSPRREFAPGSLEWAPTPLALKWQPAEDDGHNGAVIVGRIDEIWRDGALIQWRGVMDDAGVNGAEALRLIGLRMLRGVSVMADDMEDQDVEMVYPVEPMAAMDMPADEPMPPMEPDDEMLMPPMEPIKVVLHHGRIRSATLLPEPAWVEATVELGEPPTLLPGTSTEAPVVTAAAYTVTIPEVWPEAWFDEPVEAPPIGALHITPQGRVFGYLGPDRVSHRAFRASGRAVTIPRGVDYSEFQNKPCLVAGADGQVYRINAGNITFDCGHPSPYDQRRTDPGWAMQHYDNTCSVAARIRVGENRHGTWVAGGLLHGITPDAFERMMACALSGDWQNNRLNAALLVPVEGFPVAQTSSVRVRDDTVVASTVPIRFTPTPPPTPDFRPVLERLARSAGRDPAARFAALRARVGR